jgi:hypothetical protein
MSAHSAEWQAEGRRLSDEKDRVDGEYCEWQRTGV